VLAAHRRRRFQEIPQNSAFIDLGGSGEYEPEEPKFTRLYCTGESKRKFTALSFVRELKRC
jgi:hypothetical protein